ncbi:serine/arginine repetitive matrix protein 2-like isoform X2 [Homarus americanus]|uniref:serine/arginine repetitive matrix protein 2-like isoform X2 n=1 Tax=Homarus americanus TaxID=6706 RepID=UPI001C4867FA|nr:serine/arginine repetitive matrix protein 2-like isoform X2 [Homarus americanus]
MGNQNSSRAGLSQPPLTWTQSFPRENKRLKRYGATSDTKVLPQRIPGQRLRPTENGHILQTKGTLSARRMAEFHAPHHPAFPPPIVLNQQHHALHQPHSASMTALHYPHFHDERAASIHDLRFGRPPSKNYASEPDLRGPSPPTAVPSPPPHTIISQSPTKGRIKSKKKYKAPPVPPAGMIDSHSLPRGAERSHSLSDMTPQASHSQWPTPCVVHFADQPQRHMVSSPKPQKPKSRKIGLFRKKNESRRPKGGEEHRSSGEEQERGRAASEDRRAVVTPTRSSPRDELRERARSLDCLQHELRHSPVSSSVPVAASSLTHLHQPQEQRLWATLDRDSKRSSTHEVDSKRSSTIERESRRSGKDSKRISTLERDQQKSHRRMSTLERKVEERKSWTGDGRDNSTPSSTSRVSRLDSYRENTSHRRSSSSGSHHELIAEEVERRDIDDEWDQAAAKISNEKKKGREKATGDEWDTVEEQVTERKKMSANLQAELINTVKNLRKTSTEQEPKTSSLTRKGRESEKRPSKPKPTTQPSSSPAVVVDQNESQRKTFFFGMEPEMPREPRSETNTGLHKIKNQEEAAKTRNREEVFITGQTVEYSRRTLERNEKSRSRSTRKENQKVTEPQRKTVDETDGRNGGGHSDHRKLSRDVEEFAVAIERHKMSRADGDRSASGSSRREDGGYHSRQNSGSLYLDNENDVRVEGELCMNLRPTLPRRQFEIPRFSPNAAWRSLSLERASRHPEALDETRSSEEPDSVYEARIQRFTRPTAPPRGSGEKSADSGISGDAGSPGPTHEFEPLMATEKTKGSSGPLAASSPVVSGLPEVRRAWTPAQDLDDNSLDSHGEHHTALPEGLSTPPKLTSRSNMFPKSQELTPETEAESPTETETVSELVSPDKKDRWSRRKKRNPADIIPHKFNSLRKLKRSVSGAITGLGRKSPGAEDYLQSGTLDEPQTQPQGDDTNWRDNWSMSRSIPNSLNTCEEHDTGSNLSSNRNTRSRSESRLAVGGGDASPEDSRPRTPSYLQHGNSGHIMYLPEYNSRRMSRGEAGSEDESDRRHSSTSQHYDRHHNLRHSDRPMTPDHERKPPSGDEDPAQPETYHGPTSLPTSLPHSHPALASSKKAKGKKFSYQSTVRVLEKRKLEEKLTREVAEKEKLRLKEIEAMKRVEEEFQRKREREKRKVKQELKLLQMQQQQQQQQQHTSRDTHNHSYSSDDHAPSSYSSEQNEVSSQASSQPPPLPRSPAPQVYPSFTSLPPELPSDASPGLLSGLKSWVRNRKESRSSTSSTTLTSAPRQDPDGAPASSPRKISDDYSGSSSSSSRKSSTDHSDQLKQGFRAEIIAASRKRNANNPVIVHESPPPKHNNQKRSIYNHLNEVVEREAQRSQRQQSYQQEMNYSHRQKLSSKHIQKDNLRRSQSPDVRRLMQELPELHQERREYREYRSPSRHSRHSHSPPARTTSSPPASISPNKSLNNYRRDFCHGNAQVAGPTVVSVKVKRNDESDRYSKHSSDDRRSVGSSGVHRSASVDLLETGSCSSSSTARHHQSSHHLADASLSHNYGRMNGYPPVDSSPARFAHSILTPFSPVKGYRPVSFSPPPPTKILPVN